MGVSALLNEDHHCIQSFNKNSYRNIFEVLSHYCLYEAIALEQCKISQGIKTLILSLVQSFF